MIFIWRHYKGSEILVEQAVQAPCEVTAKREVTSDMKACKVVPSSYRSKWREYPFYTITAIDDMRGIAFPMSSDREYVVFFDPDYERAMKNCLTRNGDY